MPPNFSDNWEFTVCVTYYHNYDKQVVVELIDYVHTQVLSPLRSDKCCHGPHLNLYHYKLLTTPENIKTKTPFVTLK